MRKKTVILSYFYVILHLSYCINKCKRFSSFVLRIHSHTSCPVQAVLCQCQHFCWNGRCCQKDADCCQGKVVLGKGQLPPLLQGINVVSTRPLRLVPTNQPGAGTLQTPYPWCRGAQIWFYRGIAPTLLCSANCTEETTQTQDSMPASCHQISSAIVDCLVPWNSWQAAVDPCVIWTWEIKGCSSDATKIWKKEMGHIISLLNAPTLSCLSPECFSYSFVFSSCSLPESPVHLPHLLSSVLPSATDPHAHFHFPIYVICVYGLLRLGQKTVWTLRWICFLPISFITCVFCGTGVF